jgi:hypothetical protein
VMQLVNGFGTGAVIGPLIDMKAIERFEALHRRRGQQEGQGRHRAASATLRGTFDLLRVSQPCKGDDLRPMRRTPPEARAVLTKDILFGHCQLNGPRAPFSDPLRFSGQHNRRAKEFPNPTRGATDTTRIPRPLKLTMRALYYTRPRNPHHLAACCLGSHG